MGQLNSRAKGGEVVHPKSDGVSRPAEAITRPKGAVPECIDLGGMHEWA